MNHVVYNDFEMTQWSGNLETRAVIQLRMAINAYRIENGAKKLMCCASSFNFTGNHSLAADADDILCRQSKTGVRDIS
jgi:hypothetical protein